MTKASLICLALPCSSLAFATDCSSELSAANQVSALILVDQTPSSAVPKSTNVKIESTDGFRLGAFTLSFDHCGGVLQADSTQERKENSPRGILITIITLHVVRRNYVWDTDTTLRNSSTYTLAKKHCLLMLETWVFTGLTQRDSSKSTVILLKE